MWINLKSVNNRFQRCFQINYLTFWRRETLILHSQLFQCEKDEKMMVQRKESKRWKRWHDKYQAALVDLNEICLNFWKLLIHFTLWTKIIIDWLKRWTIFTLRLHLKRKTKKSLKLGKVDTEWWRIRWWESKLCEEMKILRANKE